MRCRIAGLALRIALASAAASCHSAQTSVTGPTADDKCQVTATSTPQSFAASGGNGALSIATARDCTWTIATTASWLTLSGNRSGQGDASIPYTPSPRIDRRSTKRNPTAATCVRVAAFRSRVSRKRMAPFARGRSRWIGEHGAADSYHVCARDWTAGHSDRRRRRYRLRRVESGARETTAAWSVRGRGAGGSACWRCSNETARGSTSL
jgi:hypothetical protein